MRLSDMDACRARNKKIDVYRQIRKGQTGKMMTRNTAIGELLDAALADIKVEAVVTWAELLTRVRLLGRRVDKLEQ